MHDRLCSPLWHRGLSRRVRRHSQAGVVEVASAFCMRSEIHLLHWCQVSVQIRSTNILRLMANPVAVPQRTGSRIATAGFSKAKLGSVREGM